LQYIGLDSALVYDDFGGGQEGFFRKNNSWLV